MIRQMHCGRAGLLIGLLILAGVTGAAPDAPDLSSPKSAEKAYTVAELAGDAAAMKAVAVYDDAWEKVIDARAAASRAESDLWKAARDKWGDSSREDFADRVVRDVPEIVEKIDGDRATIVFHGTVVQRLKNVDGKWKMDLVTPISDMEFDSPQETLKGMQASERAAKKVADMVRAGKCSSPADAHQALGEAFTAEYRGVAEPSTRQSATQSTTKP